MSNLKRICNEVIDVADKNPGLPWVIKYRASTNLGTKITAIYNLRV